ncbi:hypothetical protein CAEBREN_01285 [Caenorhabditis brenneri]|uniref:Uncharacterized protein n=1 Tax=Caenorhabditis brenneri TaxID=135651 RepID=G0MJN4_CAEBE|nr:hypothetical protein CAEBREN_01285 [Caenorhabditis brenneri]
MPLLLHLRPAPTIPTISTDSLQTAPENLALSFCPCTKRIAVSVKRCNGEDYKYVFDEEPNEFNPLNCVNCQPQVMETDLYPLYSVYHESQFVTFVLNAITDLWEQYVYNPEAERFEQVNIPDLIIDFSRNTSTDVLFTVNSEKGQVVIRKSEYGFLWKEKFRKELQAFVPMMSDYVKTIPLEQKLQADSLERPRLKIEYDPHTNQKVIFVLKSRRLLSVFYYNSEIAKFVKLHSDSSLSERYLYPKYVAVSESINKNVIFAKNGMTGDIEQFIYCEKTLGFEQVQVSDIVYEPSLDSKSDIIMVIPGAEDTRTIVITRHAAFRDLIKFQINPKTLQYEEIMPVEVRFLSVKQQELVLENPYSDPEARKEQIQLGKSTARIVKETLREVTQLLENTIARASEDGKVPSTSSQAVQLPIEPTQKVTKELASPKTTMMLVDENLEAEALYSSPENSSEGGRTGDVDSSRSDASHPVAKQQLKTLSERFDEFYGSKNKLDSCKSEQSPSSTKNNVKSDENPENSSEGGQTGKVDANLPDTSSSADKKRQKVIESLDKMYYGSDDASDFCKSGPAVIYIPSPKKKTESNNVKSHESSENSSEGGQTGKVDSSLPDTSHTEIKRQKVRYGFDDALDFCLIPKERKEVKPETPKNPDSDFDSDTSEIDMAEFDDEIYDSE